MTRWVSTFQREKEENLLTNKITFMVFRNRSDGRVWTIGNTINVAKIITAYTHAAQAGRPVAIGVLSEIKERAQNNRENP